MHTSCTLSTVGLNLRAVTSQFLMSHELDSSHLCVYACRKIRSGRDRWPVLTSPFHNVYLIQRKFEKNTGKNALEDSMTRT